MSTPRIFISSTYADLKETRAAVADFIYGYGFQPVIFESNDVTFQINSTIEDSCYDEIKSCDMFILLIREKFGAISKVKDYNRILSVTQMEYRVAKSFGIPIFVFIHQSSLDEYNSFVKQGEPTNFKFNYLENFHHALFVKETFEDKGIRFINGFNSIDDIRKVLKKQWAGLFNKYMQRAKKDLLDLKENVRVNAFKLFYFRRTKGISRKLLADRSGIKLKHLARIEDAGIKKRRTEVEDFESIPLSELQRLAEILQCSVGNLRAGLPDDFLSQYLQYYFQNRGAAQRRMKGNVSKPVFTTKAVVFDFDGTLAYSDQNDLTTWEIIWLKLGYAPNECFELHKQYSSSKITHREWCLLTEEKFKEKGLSKAELDVIADRVTLISGLNEVVDELISHGVQLYICSGSIDYLIKRTLGDMYFKFEEVKSNKFTFSSDGKLQSILGTKYDFEGKSHYIRQIARDNNIEPFEIFFVGNSLNDEWAHESGAWTLCVNPSMTNPEHGIYWTHSIRNMNNLNEILPFLHYKK